MDIPLPIQLRGLGELGKLPQWGPKWVLVNFELEKTILVDDEFDIFGMFIFSQIYQAMYQL